MRFNKLLKWSLIIIVVIGISIFSFVPMGIQDEIASSSDISINNYPDLVYEVLQDIHKVEGWLPGKDSGRSYTVTFDEDQLKPSFVRKDDQSGTTQTVTQLYAQSNSSDIRIKDLSFKVSFSNHGYTKRINFTVTPDGNIIAATGQNVRTTNLSTTQWIDFSTSGFFEKTIGKWRNHHTQPFYAEPELKMMNKEIKDFVEDSYGRLLDRE